MKDKEVIVMQHYIIKLSYNNRPFPRWVVGNEDFGALPESQDKAIDFLICKNVMIDSVTFEYDDKPAREDFEKMFRERFSAKLKSIS